MNTYLQQVFLVQNYTAIYSRFEVLQDWDHPYAAVLLGSINAQWRRRSQALETGEHGSSRKLQHRGHSTRKRRNRITPRTPRFVLLCSAQRSRVHHPYPVAFVPSKPSSLAGTWRPWRDAVPSLTMYPLPQQPGHEVLSRVWTQSSSRGRRYWRRSSRPARA
jgi:hypothetical protein